MADEPKIQANTPGHLWETVKYAGKSLTALPRLSWKLATGEIPKDADLPKLVKGMAVPKPEIEVRQTPTGAIKKKAL